MWLPGSIWPRYRIPVHGTLITDQINREAIIAPLCHVRAEFAESLSCSPYGRHEQLSAAPLCGPRTADCCCNVAFVHQLCLCSPFVVPTCAQTGFCEPVRFASQGQHDGLGVSRGSRSIPCAVHTQSQRLSAAPALGISLQAGGRAGEIESGRGSNREAAMQDPRTGRRRDLFAFHDTRMETAFVQHIGKHTRLSSELLRAVRFVGWTLLVARLLLQTRAGGSRADYATTAIVFLIYLATGLEDLRMLRALHIQPPVLHECRKSRNVLRFMLGRMVVAVLMTPTELPFTSAPAIALLTGIDMVSDRVRLRVGLRMLALSCLACFCTLVGQVKVSGTAVALAVGGTALIAVSGFLLPAAVLACLELRSRLAFIGMHPPAAQKQLAPRWHAFAEALQWPLPFPVAQQQQQQQHHHHHHHDQQQQQQPWPQLQPVRTCSSLPRSAAKQPDRRCGSGRSRRAESPSSVLDARL